MLWIRSLSSKLERFSLSDSPSSSKMRQTLKPCVFHPKGRLLALPINIRLEWLCIIIENGPDYFQKCNIKYTQRENAENKMEVTVKNSLAYYSKV